MQSVSSRIWTRVAVSISYNDNYYTTHIWDDKGIHVIPKGICPKVNVIGNWSSKSLTTIPQSSALTIRLRGHALRQY